MAFVPANNQGWSGIVSMAGFGRIAEEEA